MAKLLLAVNAGSSSIKFALYRREIPLVCLARGKIERVGLAASKLVVAPSDSGQVRSIAVTAQNHKQACDTVVTWLEAQQLLSHVSAVGHRVVHGGPRYDTPTVVNPGLIENLRSLSAYSPNHLPAEIALIERLSERIPHARQIACFDTTFHRDMPCVAQLLPIPRRYFKKGVRRYGFHGLSYEYLMEELERRAGSASASGRIVLAHLGNGSSLAAVLHRKSVETTMAFTPAAGIPMGTRSGDLDPGLVWYLAQTENMNIEQFHRMANHESGLLGISETSSDMLDLLGLEAHDVRAAAAISFYCYQITKAIGSLAAVLGGVDSLIFSGGIGENAPVIRSRICDRLGLLGLCLDPAANAANETEISGRDSNVRVYAIRTDEEIMIARLTERAIRRISHNHQKGTTP